MKRLVLALGVIFSANLHSAQSTTVDKTNVVGTTASSNTSSTEQSFSVAQKAHPWGLAAGE